MPKVLIADALSPRALAVFAERGVEADVRTGLAPDELAAALPQYDGLAVRSATKVTAQTVAAAGRLKVIGRAGIGVDNIDVAAATQRGIVVMNTPYGNAITTAEHTIALLFALAREIPAADRSTQAGRWEKSRDLGVELVGFDELLARSDFITLHTPLTEATRNLIDAAALAKMKRGVRLINCARGGLVVEADLAAALDSGQVAGAAVDAFVDEPAGRDNPLFGRDNVVATPHLGAATSEAQENVAVQIAEQMADYLLTGAISNAVNMPSLTAEEAARLRPYMKLAEQLGSFAGQLTETEIAAVDIDYEGAVAGHNVKPLTAIALTALLAPQLSTINMVNAPLICRERDIRVSETLRADPGDYKTLIRLAVTFAGKRRAVEGTLFAGDKPRLVSVAGIPLEAELGRHVLYVRNYDKPGFIGALGQTLAAAEVNIATLHLGRTAPGEDAILLAGVDQELTAPLLEAVRALPNVIEVKALRF